MKLATRTFTILLVLLAVTGIAFAQEAAAEGVDIGSWFASTAALSAVIIALVAFVKKNLIPALTGVATVFVSLALGAAAGLLGHFAGYLDGGIVPALTFGVSAGFLASGGWDAFASLLGKRAPAE